MVFTPAVSITPCLTQKLSPESRKKLKEYYRTAKKYGIRGLLSVVSQFIFFACGQYSGISSCFSVK